MKKGILCLLAVTLLLLTGCKQEAATKIINKDALCPYTVESQDQGIYIQVDVSALPELQWQATVFPENVCRLTTRENAPTGEVIYDIAPAEDGIATVTIVGTGGNGNDAGRFTLEVDLQVESGKAKGLSAAHQQKETFEEAIGEASYSWEVNAEGTLEFSFNRGPNWYATAEPTPVCNVCNIMFTPSGCRFEATPLTAGTATVRVFEMETQETYLVTLQVNEALEISVTAVEEQADD